MLFCAAWGCRCLLYTSHTRIRHAVSTVAVVALVSGFALMVLGTSLARPILSAMSTVSYTHLNNNISTKVEYRKTRVLNLSMTSQQLTETRSNDFVIGAGYKISGAKLFAPKKTVKSRRRGNRSSNQQNEQASSSRGFSNDLNLRFDISVSYTHLYGSGRAEENLRPLERQR